MTTLEPGASVVFTQGLLDSPASTALRASSAAPTMTDGFEVLVHEVMAAMATEPSSAEVFVPLSRVTCTGAEGRPDGSSATGSEAGNVPLSPFSRPGPETYAPGAARHAGIASASAPRSCGRFGPAIDGTTVDRSSSTSSEYLAVWPGSCQSPCSLAYASTRATCSAGRPVSRR